MGTSEVVMNAFLHYDIATNPWDQGVEYNFTRTSD